MAFSAGIPYLGFVKQTYTVFASYVDSGEIYNTYIDALDSKEARAKVCSKASGVIKIVAVVLGKIKWEKDVLDEGILELPRNKQSLLISIVNVSKRNIEVNGKCPKCKTSLKRPGALIETYFSAKEWPGHLDFSGTGFSTERDSLPSLRQSDGAINVVKLRCALCCTAVWNGVSHV